MGLAPASAADVRKFRSLGDGILLGARPFSWEKHYLRLKSGFFLSLVLSQMLVIDVKLLEFRKKKKTNKRLRVKIGEGVNFFGNSVMVADLMDFGITCHAQQKQW